MTVTITLDRSAAPRRHRLRSLLDRARAVMTHSVTATRAAARSKPMVNLRSVPLTVAGIGCIDGAFFTWHLFAGLLVTGVSLFILEHVIADEN